MRARKKKLGDLTPTQLKIYDFIVAYRKEHRLSPALRQIADHMGTRVPTVFEHTNKMVEFGWLEKRKGRQRNLVPVA